MPMRVPCLLLLLSAACSAQWLNYHAPGTPRLANGKPNLSAPAPRALDGHPDLSGVWHVHPTSLEEMKRIFGARAGDNNPPGMEIDTLSKYALDIFIDFPRDKEPLKPQALELYQRRLKSGETRPTCLPVGIPAAGLVSEPFKISQSHSLMVMLYESDGTHRQIYLDGRPLPKEFEQPAWLGYSTAKWDGETLVVESAGFNDKTWLDLNAHPHSEALHVTERYHRRDFGHMDLEMTFDDPGTLTHPFSVKVAEDLWPDSDIFEYFCDENERDSKHVVK
ncbi:MAG TPA: hypothetical protein VFW44_10345 [Bryobacteraceae bacterium]|nr:hypothetical protein [Bryobacteraceae bacterium]